MRHYLIERTPTGHVRLKGCPNEPDFSRFSFCSAFCGLVSCQQTIGNDRKCRARGKNAARFLTSREKVARMSSRPSTVGATWPSLFKCWSYFMRRLAINLKWQSVLSSQSLCLGLSTFSNTIGFANSLGPPFDRHYRGLSSVDSSTSREQQENVSEGFIGERSGCVLNSSRFVDTRPSLRSLSACNVLYLNNVDVESLSGQLAVSKALAATFDHPDRLQATVVHFKVSNTGITLTDTKKKWEKHRWTAAIQTTRDTTIDLDYSHGAISPRNTSPTAALITKRIVCGHFNTRIWRCCLEQGIIETRWTLQLIKFFLLLLSDVSALCRRKSTAIANRVKWKTNVISLPRSIAINRRRPSSILSRKWWSAAFLSERPASLCDHQHAKQEENSREQNLKKKYFLFFFFSILLQTMNALKMISSIAHARAIRKCSSVSLSCFDTSSSSFNTRSLAVFVSVCIFNFSFVLWIVLIYHPIVWPFSFCSTFRIFFAAICSLSLNIFVSRKQLFVSVCFVVANGTLLLCFRSFPWNFLSLGFCCVHACWSQVIIFSFYWRSPRDALQVCWIFVFASVCLTLVEQIRIDENDEEEEKEDCLLIDRQNWIDRCSIVRRKQHRG